MYARPLSDCRCECLESFATGVTYSGHLGDVVCAPKPLLGLAPALVRAGERPGERFPVEKATDLLFDHRGGLASAALHLLVVSAAPRRYVVQRVAATTDIASKQPVFSKRLQVALPYARTPTEKRVQEEGSL